MMLRCLEEEALDFVVQDEYEGTAGTSEDVGERALEEGAASLSLEDGCPAVGGALVCHVGLGAPGLHHHPPTDGVEGV